MRLAALALLAALPLGVTAKPIAFADAWTVMGEYGTNTMREAMVFYTPAYWWSGGMVYTKLIADDKSFEREMSGVQASYLVKRWNMPDAQANVYVWGGVASARGFDNGGSFSGVATARYGAQADYETRRVFASAKTDWSQSSRFTHGVSTVQLAVAPFEHDYEDLAVWFLVQARRFTGGILPGKTEVIPMIRLFKGSFWIEAGVDRESRAQVMVMVNF